VSTALTKGDINNSVDLLIDAQSSPSIVPALQNENTVEGPQPLQPLEQSDQKSNSQSPITGVIIDEYHRRTGLLPPDMPKSAGQDRIVPLPARGENSPVRKTRSRTPQEKFRQVMHKLKAKLSPKLMIPLTPPKMLDSSYVTEHQIIEERCQWDIIRNIDNDVLKNLLLESLPDDRKKAAARTRGISGGAYHHVVFLDAMDRKARKEDL
jgi:hypothetical protein